MTSAASSPLAPFVAALSHPAQALPTNDVSPAPPKPRTVADVLIEDLADELVAANACVRNLAEDLAATRELQHVTLDALAETVAERDRLREANRLLRQELQRYVRAKVTDREAAA